MTINQLSFAYVIPSASVGPSILMVDNSQPTTENIGVKMYSSLMGTFNFMALVHHIYAMYSRPIFSERSAPFHTSYFNNPWTLPSSISYCEGHSHTGMTIPLLTMKIAYQTILDSSIQILLPHRQMRKILSWSLCGPLRHLGHMTALMRLFLRMKISSRP
jgi:hypothetical protein